METTKKVFEVRRTMIKEEEEKNKFIFERNDVGTWFFKAPEASTYTIDDLADVIDILKELYEQESLKKE